MSDLVIDVDQLVLLDILVLLKILFYMFNSPNDASNIEKGN